MNKNTLQRCEDGNYRSKNGVFLLKHGTRHGQEVWRLYKNNVQIEIEPYTVEQAQRIIDNFCLVKKPGR